MKLSGNKILITGGATGIGLGLTERLIKEGNTVIVCGRRMEALQEAKAKFPTLIIKQCDVANEQERMALHQWIASEHADLNVLVNNAGIQNWMKIDDADFFEKANLNFRVKKADLRTYIYYRNIHTSICSSMKNKNLSTH